MGKSLQKPPDRFLSHRQHTPKRCLKFPPPVPCSRAEISIKFPLSLPLISHLVNILEGFSSRIKSLIAGCECFGSPLDLQRRTGDKYCPKDLRSPNVPVPVTRHYLKDIIMYSSLERHDLPSDF